MANAGQNTASPQDIRQIVNKNTQQRKRKRAVLNLILLLLFLLLLIGLGLMTYFIVYKSLQAPTKEVVLDINFETYATSSSGEETLDGWDIYHFKAGENSSSRTSNFNHQLYADRDLRMDYKINNVLNTEYKYVIDFTNLTFDVNGNCKLTYSIKENGADVTTKQDLPIGGVIEYSSPEDITISVFLSVEDSEMDASCTGNIVFTIAVV